jgi:hypothetical protein
VPTFPTKLHSSKRASQKFGTKREKKAVPSRDWDLIHKFQKASQAAADVSIAAHHAAQEKFKSAVAEAEYAAEEVLKAELELARAISMIEDMVQGALAETAFTPALLNTAAHGGAMGYLSAHHWAQKEIHYRQARWRREHPAPGMPVEKRRATLTLTRPSRASASLSN